MKNIVMQDYGRAEYLDGAMMQYAVYKYHRNRNPDTLAFFARRVDAIKFAKLLGGVYGIRKEKSK